ncbi:MAG: hypothetical protein ACJ702_01240 [Nitrososphaeraceae archaeon]
MSCNGSKVKRAEIYRLRLFRPMYRTGNQESKSMDVIINGVKLENLENYRIQSPLFDVTFPENNIFSVKPGSTKAVSDGYWVFSEPLTV